MTGGSQFRYSRWDGTQTGFELNAFDVLEEITDDLLYHGDLNAALRRMMQSGFTDQNGERLQGVREMLEKLRRRRKDQLDRYDLGGVYDDIAQQLREVVDTERATLDQLDRAAQESGDQRRQEVTGEAMAERRMELDLLPPDLNGMVKELQQYDFVSPEARERFEGLLDELRQQLAQRWFNQMAGAMSDVSPEAMARTKDMLAELNRMLEDRAAGREPDFDGFMDRYGDMFPENPQNLDELLEAMARRMAAMQAMLNSMTPEQRAQLEGLAEQLMEDMDLRWQMDQLSANLQQAFPDAGWGRSYDFQGVLTLFSPGSKEKDVVLPNEPAEIDVLIGTDCISEGQNLQDCDYLINYDIHWNPVRIIQRFGRVDRIGSPNDRVQLVNFWPNMELEEYIDLERRVSGRATGCDRLRGRPSDRSG